MWKFVSRGVREAVERNLNIGRSTTEVRVQKEKPTVNYCQRLVPCINNEKWKHCGSSRSENSNQKNENSTGFRPSWFSAFSYSGALALGWMLSQPCLWKKWVGLPDRRNDRKKLRILDLVPSTAWTQPIIPGAVTAINYCGNDISEGPIHGPKTAEEALDEAAEEFRAVHNSILAEVENKRAVDLMKRKKNREALELFISASHRGYGPAAYNLAQCFELGIGIKQNFHEAAKWYQTAVDRGHLTAMYNLGVFYVHGWGGLKADTKKARQLFTEAAKRGQPDAKAALGIRETPDVPPVPEISSVSGDIAKHESWNSSSDDFSSTLDNVSNNPEEIFKLASSFETSVDPDPVTSQLTLELYKIASDMGHAEAKSRVQVLEMLKSIGIVQEGSTFEERRTSDFPVGQMAAFNY